MANVLGVSRDTLERRYAAFINKNRDIGKSTLRRKLHYLAFEKNNLGALIWLSKQHLGMSEKLTTEEGDVTKDASAKIEYATAWGGEAKEGP